MKSSLIHHIFPNYTTICVPYTDNDKCYSLAVQYSKSLNQARIKFIGKQQQCQVYNNLVNRLVPYLQNPENGTVEKRIANVQEMAYMIALSTQKIMEHENAVAYR